MDNKGHGYYWDNGTQAWKEVSGYDIDSYPIASAEQLAVYGTGISELPQVTLQVCSLWQCGAYFRYSFSLHTSYFQTERKNWI